MIDFDDFDWEDAAVLGGIAGFVEESLREERNGEPREEEVWRGSPLEKEDYEEPVSLRRQLQMLRASNPALADHVIRKALEFRAQGELRRESERQKEELLKKCEWIQKMKAETGVEPAREADERQSMWMEYQGGGLDDKDYEENPVLFFLDEMHAVGEPVEIDYVSANEKLSRKLVIRPERNMKYKGHVYVEAILEPRGRTEFLRADQIRNAKIPDGHKG